MDPYAGVIMIFLIFFLDLALDLVLLSFSCSSPYSCSFFCSWFYSHILFCSCSCISVLVLISPPVLVLAPMIDVLLIFASPPVFFLIFILFHGLLEHSWYYLCSYSAHTRDLLFLISFYTMRIKTLYKDLWKENVTDMINV